MATTNKAKNNRAQRRLRERQQRRQASAHTASAPSTRAAPPPSPSRALPADKRGLLESFDGFAHLRNKLRELGHMRGDWAGIPMPQNGLPLVIEPSYPKAKELMAINAPERDEDKEAGLAERNSWYSMTRRSTIHIIQTREGKIDWGLTPGIHSLPMALATLDASDAWGVEQEANAVQLLGTLVSHRQFKQYMLTGMFIEASRRSGTYYLFRRLRPTVAIAADKGKTRILCALCMHPIAYYAGTWAGAMCPTDDVVAHLTLMRGDERKFWSRCNQHPSWIPQAGL